MKLLLAVALLFPATVLSTDTCPSQSRCMKIGITNVGPDCNADCAYEICIELFFGNSGSSGTGQGCQKLKLAADGSANTFDKVCYSTTQCKNTPTTFVSEAKNFAKFCETVPVGGVAKFLLYDADSAPRNCVPGPINITTDTAIVPDENCVQCFPSTRACGPADYTPCEWHIKAPKLCITSGKTGRACGDPHIKPWQGKGYSYHGEGDFVLVRSDDFSNGLGLEVQMRTTIKDFYSFIEAVAVRIGESVFQVTMGRFWLDGVEFTTEALPTTLSGYTINAPVLSGNAMVYKIDLSNGDAIEIAAYKDLLSVSVTGSPNDFANSVGLMGSFGDGQWYARDGFNVISDVNEFGSEWQVRGTEEANLFSSHRSPQYPEPPRLPSAEVSKARRRALLENKDLEEAAFAACGDKAPEEFDFCVFDVMATGDIGMAGAW